MGTGAPLRPPRRKKSKKRANIYEGPDDAPPVGEPVAPPLKKIRLPIQTSETNVLVDDRGFPDKQIDYDFLEDGEPREPVLRKVVPELPSSVDPDFDVAYSEAKHGEYLRTHLKTGHLPTGVAAKLVAIIKKHWRVFDPDGLKHTVIGYECDIDTGNAKPISCGNVNYGPRESVIMKKHIANLLSVNHICQIPRSYWMSKALLAAKPIKNQSMTSRTSNGGFV